LYALLGSNLDRSDDLDLNEKSVLAVFDLSTLTWQEELIEINDSWADDGTSSGAALVWDRFDRIYALQGDAENNASANFASYSLSTGRWLDLAEMPELSFSNNNCGVAEGASLAYLGHINEDQSNYI